MSLSSFVTPKKIEFETDLDVVRYTAGGLLPPKKQNFEAVMEALTADPEMRSNGDGDFDGDSLASAVFTPSGTEIVISYIPKDNEALRKYMEEVYKRRCRNRNILLTVAGIAAVGLIIGKIKHSHHDKQEATDCSYVSLEVPEDMK